MKEKLFDELPATTKASPFVAEIGNDVWIGNNVIILDGLHIADGSIIGAGSVVTKDTEPFSINIGVPGRLIRYRFGPAAITFLTEFKWWERGFEWIRSNAEKFVCIEKFCSAMRPPNNQNHMKDREHVEGGEVS